MTRDEILLALARDRANLMAALDGIPEPTWVMHPVVGTWTIKDVLGHMAMWQEVAVQFIAGYREHGVPESLGLNDDAAVNAYNDRGAAQRHDWPLARVRAESDAAHQSLVSAVEGLTDADLNTPLPAPWHSATTLEKLIAINSYTHDPEHIEQISRWKQTNANPG